MVWQDIVFSGVNIIFMVALIPQIYQGFKFKKGSIMISTSAPTGIGLYIMAATYYTMQLYYSTIVTIIAGLLWTILFIQRVIYKNY